MLFIKTSRLLLATCALCCTAAIELRDYFSSTSSFDGLLYGDGSSYTLHEIRIEIAVNNFQWVLLGFPRPCTINIDNSPDYGCSLKLQGHSSKYIAFPKKRYSVAFETDDDVDHEVNLRNVRIDPSFSREKLFHDVVSSLDTTAIKVSHARVYINGEYNGLYVVAENIDSQFMYDNVKGMDTTLTHYNNNPDFETTAVVMEAEIEDGKLEIEDDETSVRTWGEAEDDVYSGNVDKDSIFYHFYSKIHPYQKSSSVFDFKSLLAVAGSKQFMQVGDFNTWNYFYAVALLEGTTNVTKLQIIAWDTDKLLGLVNRGDVVSESLLPEKNWGFTSFERQFFFSEVDVIESKNYDGPSQYVGMTENDAYTEHMLTALEDDNVLSLTAITDVIDILRSTLSEEAAEDAEKWDKWFDDDRLTFEEAMDELSYLMTVRHEQYKYELNGSSADEYPYATAAYSEYYYDDEYGWKYATANPSMVALLSVILGANILSFLFPDCNNNNLLTKIGWLRALTHIHDEVELQKMTAQEIFQAYLKTCIPRILEYGYALNVLIAAVFLGGYYAFVLYDFTDDSEILGHHYLVSVRFVWLYFAISMNLCFLVRNNKFRVITWILIVLATNFYGIYDLFEFSQVTGKADAVNSRGHVVSLDGDNTHTFYLYVCMRLLCQATVMRYSLEIPLVSKLLAKSIEEESDDKKNGFSDVYVANEDSDAAPKGDLEMIQTPVASALMGDNEGEQTENDDAPAEKVDDSNKPELSANLENKRRMKLFMLVNMAVFILICVAFIIYIFVSGLSSNLNFRELFFSVLISVAILINIRAFYSCIKYFWLHAYGFDSDTLDIIFGNREDEEKWSLDRLKKMELVPRESAYSFLLPGIELSTEKKMRTVDGWTKKIAHTYDGLLVFILSAQSFSSSENAAETYSLAYLISLLYMILYVISYRQNGTLGWIIYGAKSRIMDGYLGRENEIFGYMFDKYMLPVSAPLLLWLQNIAGNSRTLYLSWYIFMPIIVGDSFAEIIGATWGKQKLKVWGMGEVNKKSWEGTAAMFFSSFLILLPVNIYFNLGWEWYIFAFFICLIATFVELYAYRSTDNVCMLIISALLSVAFISMIEA